MVLLEPPAIVFDERSGYARLFEAYLDASKETQQKILQMYRPPEANVKVHLDEKRKKIRVKRKQLLVHQYNLYLQANPSRKDVLPFSLAEQLIGIVDANAHGQAHAFQARHNIDMVSTSRILWGPPKSSVWALNIVLALSSLCLPYVGGSRAYPLGCSQEDSSYYDYDNCPFPLPQVPVKSSEDYQLVERLGTGKFGDVFSAVEMDNEKEMPKESMLEVDPSSLVVIKCLKPVTDRKIRRELLILFHASKLPNLARLLAVVLHPEYYASQRSPTKLPRMPSLAMKYAGPNAQFLCHPTPNTKVTSTQKEVDGDFLSEYEIKYFLFQLLVALDALHSKGIMHRDVKPRNILISRNIGSHIDNSSPPAPRSTHSDKAVGPLMLIDLGLADFYLPNTCYNVRVASRHYKSPELLINYQFYDYGVDLWPVGCILAGLLFRKEPFFRGKDNMGQLGKIVSVLGTPDLIAYIARFKIGTSADVRKIISEHGARERSRNGAHASNMRVRWLSFLSAGCPVPSQEGLDLLDKVLVYDHDIRLTAREAMSHPFFDAVRDRVTNEVRASALANSSY